MTTITKEELDELYRDALKGLSDNQYEICVNDNLMEEFVGIPPEEQGLLFKEIYSRTNS